jgi:hypothetical protein
MFIFFFKNSFVSYQSIGVWNRITVEGYWHRNFLFVHGGHGIVGAGAGLNPQTLSAYGRIPNVGWKYLREVITLKNLNKS